MQPKTILRITILTDKSSWMNAYDKILEARLKFKGHHVVTVSSRENIQCGDIAFFLSCFEIIKRPLLGRNKHNIVVHASNLPHGKGWSPASWQILSGINEIPLTLFEATEAVDAGDVYERDTIYLDGSELINEWQHKLGEKIVDMCCAFVDCVVEGKVQGVPQNGQETFYQRRKPKDSELDINKSLSEQFNLLRIVDNEKYPAFFNYRGRKYQIKIEVAKDE